MLQPEERFVNLLIEKQMTVTTAESCTGGLLSGTIVNVAGVSDVFHQSYVTYANSAKHELIGVPEETLETFGAVSQQTAKAMAEGAAKAAKADVALAVTGIAGPGGGTKEKPVGLVYIGCCVNGHTEVIECHFSGSRLEIRQATVAKALEFGYRCVMNDENN